MLGVGGQNEDLTRQATQNLEAITETGSVLMRGFQDVSREWLELMQERLRKNAEGMTKLAQCRTLPDLAAVQSDLARDNLNQIIDLTRRIAYESEGGLLINSVRLGRSRNWSQEISDISTIV